MMDFSKLMNMYWHLRYTRNKSTKRNHYRYIAMEKKRLLEAGVDPEELRLFCRSLARQWNIHAEKRLAAYRKQMSEDREISENL